MPTYEYACAKCGKVFELRQSIKAVPLKTCPKEECRQSKWGKGRVKRLVGTGGGIIFKGSGFYGTDYRSANYQAGAKKDSAPSADTAKPSTPAVKESKSDPTKPAAGASGKKA